MGLLCTFSPCLPAGRSYLDLQDLKSWKVGDTPSRRASVSLQEGLRARTEPGCLGLKGQVGA